MVFNLLLQRPVVCVGQRRVRKVDRSVDDGEDAHGYPGCGRICLREMVGGDESKPELEDHGPSGQPKDSPHEVHQGFCNGLVHRLIVEACRQHGGQVVDHEPNEDPTGQGFRIVVLVI